ncbi:MAG: o-succinylbenzoate synthase, partial [Microcoleus sp.]
MSAIYQFQFHPYQRKFKRPLQTSHGIWEIREGIILQLTSENNRISWGEIAPLSWFGSESLQQALDFCKQLPSKISEETIFAISPELSACQFGFESAISNYKNSPPLTQGGEKMADISNYKNSPTPTPPYQEGEIIIDSIDRDNELQRYSGLLPAGETAIQAMQMLWQKGHRTFKWKIGVAQIEAELKMFDRLLQAMHEIGDRELLLLRLDANCGLNYHQATTWLEACDR